MLFYVYEIKWVKNGELLNLENNRYFGGCLNDKYFIIILLILDGKGIYLCIVINVVGFVLKDFMFGNN